MLERQRLSESFLERVLPSLSDDVKVDVLSIGLGGGIVNGFLHYNFPQVNITVVEHSSQVFRMAKKWFGLRIDERQRVEIADGVEFIARSVKKGAAVLTSTARPCPERRCPISEQPFIMSDKLYSL
ncbi:hypothetical protein Q1695_014213 [Nippostrongylus brasiliensis]|nr:hypothetical protein Q1695_014213 [Nippostrongylus brasiliensis]